MDKILIIKIQNWLDDIFKTSKRYKIWVVPNCGIGMNSLLILFY